MQNAFDFVSLSHSAGHKSLFRGTAQKMGDFSAFRYNGDKLHFFFVDHRSRCHFFDAISIAIYAG
jgi:hypothetical protein